MSRTDVFVIAGEASGDMHASLLINELKQITPDVTAEGIGGDKLASAGVRLFYNYSEINFAGFGEIIKNYAHIRKKLTEVKKHILKTNPKILLLTDFPGFNLKLAGEIRKDFKGKIFYYITPQIWAWHKSRIKKIKKYIDVCLVIFPFEKEIFSKAGVKSYYVGHPLVKMIDSFLEGKAKKTGSNNVVTLMPGSRLQEVRRILPVMAESADELIEKYNCNVNIICSGNIEESVFSELIKNAKIKRIDSSDNLETIYNSNFVMTKFGTATLECGLLGTPFCAVYKASFFNYLIGKTMIQIDFVALVNIILKKGAVKEFIQKDFNKTNIINEYLKVTNDEEYMNDMIMEFTNLKKYFETAKIDKPAANIISEELTAL
ncbi:MAG: lipid-A-disaccharide synthase [Ignavibacteria bacterium]|nr:lipid-A-disaccharide synthase [Ignavibacteria bacterium]